MRGCALLLLLLTATSCSYVSDYFFDPTEREEYPNIPALERVVVTYSDEMERYNRLFLSDSRTFYDHYIEYVWMKFRTEANMDVYEGRDLMVHVVEGFLARVNEDPQVSEDLYNFPFTADNLIVEIDFDSFMGKYLDTRYLARLHLQDGTLYYYANDAMDRDTIRFHQRIEPYEKAYRFSRFKHYRPWLKRPPRYGYRVRDATEPQGARHDRGAYSNVPPAPHAKPAPKLSPTQNLLQNPSSGGGGGGGSGGSSGLRSSSFGH